MDKTKEWVSNITGLQYVYPIVELEEDEVVGLPNKESTCRLYGDEQLVGGSCYDIDCPKCVYYRTGGISDYEFLEFYAEIWEGQPRKREIRYEVIKQNKSSVRIKITYQSHTEPDFSKEGPFFRNLCSCGMPMYYGKTFYVKGYDNDEDTLQVPREEYYRFAFDVYLYNKTEGGYKEIEG